MKVSPNELKEYFDIVRGMDSITDWSPRYNVAPTTVMLCIRETDSGRELFPARWGLDPGWAKGKAFSTFNARSDSVATKPMFRSAFKSKRCLVVASGFYEWKKLTPKTKQPYYITLTNNEPMPMAGLWEVYAGDDGKPVESCTICTTEANEFMSELHDRMPVILPDALISPWLDRSITKADEIQPMLGQFPSNEMQCWPVASDVGNVKNKGEHLIEQIESQ